MLSHNFIPRVSEQNVAIKEEAELNYWRKQIANEGTLRNEHYESAYTDLFALNREWYRDRTVLDIGCGPRGSLEWADMAADCVGIDPLSERYREFGTDHHRMRYISSGAEVIPFSDGSFDVVCSFNSLDHVENPDRVIGEIKRVTAKGGWFLLITDVNHTPTEAEPITFEWDLLDQFYPEFLPVHVRHFEKNMGSIYASIREARYYDHDNRTHRYGVLQARMQRR